MEGDIQQINYEAVLADLIARKEKLESAIESIRQIMGQNVSGPSGGPGGGISPSGKPAHDAFIGMSIPEAAKKHLTAVRRKLSTQDLMAAFTEGGLPESKYNVVYAILRRREKQVGDIIGMKGDWALAEWYPNYRKKSKSENQSAEDEGGDQKAQPESQGADKVKAQAS